MAAGALQRTGPAWALNSAPPSRQPAAITPAGLYRPRSSDGGCRAAATRTRPAGRLVHPADSPPPHAVVRSAITSCQDWVAAPVTVAYPLSHAALVARRLRLAAAQLATTRCNWASSTATTRGIPLSAAVVRDTDGDSLGWGARTASSLDGSSAAAGTVPASPRPLHFSSVYFRYKGLGGVRGIGPAGRLTG